MNTTDATHSWGINSCQCHCYDCIRFLCYGLPSSRDLLDLQKENNSVIGTLGSRSIDVGLLFLHDFWLKL